MTQKSKTYSLLDKDVLERIEARDWFVEAVDQFYAHVAANWGTAVVMSERRLGDAWDLWADDAARTKEFGFKIQDNSLVRASPLKPVRLDHFKVGSIIAFWLRRTCPINETQIIPPEFTGEAARDFSIDTDINLFVNSATEEQKHFIDYGNEISALLAGFYIILVGEIQVYEQNLGKGKRLKDGAIDSILERISLSDTVLFEYPKLLKAKNISWHSLFMVYHSLFDTIDIRRLGSSSV